MKNNIKTKDCIVINPLEIQPKAQQKWWSGLDENARQLTITKVEKTKIKGTIAGEWPLPGHHMKLTEIKLELERLEEGLETNSFELISAIGYITFNGQKFELTGTPNPAGYINFNAIAPEVGLNLLPDESNDKPNIQALKIFIGNLQLGYSTLLKNSNPQEATESWTVNLPNLSIDGVKPKITAIRLNYTRLVNKGFRNMSPALILQGEIKLEKTYGVTLRVSRGKRIQMDIFAPNNEGFSGPAKLLEIIGFEAAGKQFDEGLKSVPLIDSIQLNQVRIVFDLEHKNFEELGLFGSVMVDNYKAKLSFNYPTMRARAWLDPKTPIPIGQLLKKMLPNASGLPENMMVSALEMNLNAKPFSFGFRTKIENLWEFHLGNTPIHIDSIEVGATIDENKNISGHFLGQIRLGEIDFQVGAQRTASDDSSKWLLSSRVANNTGIRIDEFLKSMAGYIDVPIPQGLPEINIYNIHLNFDTETKAFRFEASARLEKPLGKFDTAQTSIIIDIRKDEKTGKRKVRINLKGLFEISKTKLNFEADLGHPNWHLSADWNKGDGLPINLLEFVKLFNKEANINDVPESVKKELGLGALSLKYEHEHKACTISAENSTGKVAIMLQVANTEKGWGAIFGLKYTNIKDMPEFGGALSKHGKGLNLENAWVLFSWMPDDVDQLPAPPGNNKFPLSPKELGKGLALGATLNLQDSDPKLVGNLKGATDVTQFLIKGQIKLVDKLPEISLGILWQGELAFDTGNANPLILRNCGVSIKLSSKNFAITAYGDIEFPIDSYKVISHVELDLSLKGIILKGYAKVPDGGLPLFGLKNVKLHSAGILLGIGFTPSPSVDLGFTAEITFRENYTQYEALGAILAFSGPIPNPKYIAIDISKISLAEFLKSFEDNNWNNRHYISDDLVKAEAISFYMAQQSIKLPDGTTAKQGLGFHALFTIHGWKSWFSFKVSKSTGFRADGQFAHIKKDGFEVSGNAKDLYLLAAEKNGKWEFVSNAKRVPEGTKTEPRKAIQGGGAFIHFNSLHSPFLNADFKIKLLDAFQFKIAILIADNGINCNLVVHIPGLYNLNQTVIIKPPQILHSKGSFNAGPQVKIGFPIFDTVGLYISGHQDIQTGTEHAFHFHFDYGYKILGITLPGISLHIPHAPRNFGDVVEICVKNFFDNTIGKLIEILVNPFKSKKISYQELQNYGSGNAYDLSKFEPLEWMDVVEVFLEENLSKLNNHPNETLLATWQSLLNKAMIETHEEEQYSSEFMSVLGKLHPNRFESAMFEMKHTIGGLEREWKELADINGQLERKIERIWKQHEKTIEQAWFYDAEVFAPLKAQGLPTGHVQSYRDNLNKQLSNWGEACLTLHSKANSLTDYLEHEDYFSEVAVTYFKELIEIEGLGEIECNFIRKKAKEMARLKPDAIVDYINIPLNNK